MVRDVLSTPRPASELATALGLDPSAIPLLDQALTHRSCSYETGEANNERLEMLGDTMLTAATTRWLYETFPDDTEGQLAKERAGLINMRALARIAGGLRLGEYVKLGFGERAAGGQEKSSILADTLEAVIGAVWLGAGSAAAADLVCRLLMAG